MDETPKVPSDDLVHEPDATPPADPPPLADSSPATGWRWLWLLVPIAIVVGLVLWIVT